MSSESPVKARDLLIYVVFGRIAQHFPVRCESWSSNSVLVVLVALMNAMLDRFFRLFLLADSKQADRRVDSRTDARRSIRPTGSERSP